MHRRPLIEREPKPRHPHARGADAVARVAVDPAVIDRLAEHLADLDHHAPRQVRMLRMHLGDESGDVVRTDRSDVTRAKLRNEPPDVVRAILLRFGLDGLGRDQLAVGLGPLGDGAVARQNATEGRGEQCHGTSFCCDRNARRSAHSVVIQASTQAPTTNCHSRSGRAAAWRVCVTCPG